MIISIRVIGNKRETDMLLPLPEAGFLGLDLLGEALSEGFFLFLELGVVRLLDTGLAKLASLHLLQAIVLVVVFLSGVDQIQHVGTDQQRSQLAEVAVVLIFNCTIFSLGVSEIDKTLPSATPQRYSRPFTVLPSLVTTSSVEPMMEYGMASASARA
jgi:hypothetical protein